MPNTNNQPTSSPELSLVEKGIARLDRGLGVADQDAIGLAGTAAGLSAGVIAYVGVDHLMDVMGNNDLIDISDRIGVLEARVSGIEAETAQPETPALLEAVPVASGALAGIFVMGIAIKIIKDRASNIRGWAGPKVSN